jgi:thiamine biosynthesis lipoprotein
LSPELVEVLRGCDRWQNATRGAFHPGAEALTQLWCQAADAGRLPRDTERLAVVANLRTPPWVWTGTHTARPLADYPISLNAIAKGAIIERVCRTMQSLPGVQGALAKIGGDLRVSGTLTTTVDVAGPTPSLVPSRLLDRVTVRDQALATSSGAFRGVTIDGRWYSHLLDPRTGWPVDHIRSVSVLAPDAMTADALATACSVLSVEEGLQLLDETPGVSGLLFDREGNTHCGRHWPTSAQTVAMAAEPSIPAWNGGMELEVAFELNQPVSGSRYRRPYLAIWVEDGDGFPVRTLVLWVQTSGPGPRWIPDLKRWYRSDRVRKAADGTDLVPTVSEATRKAGKYSVIWNGTDDAGTLVKPGDYTLYIEAAREHGTYQLIRRPITVRDRPFSQKVEGNTEIKSATIEYRKPKPLPGAKTGA